MKNSIGGIPALVLVMFFIVVISGYIAFTINYSKAFKVNSKIIDTIETIAENTNVVQNGGINAAFMGNLNSQIQPYLTEVGYSASTEQAAKVCKSTGQTIDEDNDFAPVSSGNSVWCIKPVFSTEDKKTGTVYFEVKTFISVDIPILNKVLLGNRFFQVNGATKSIYINKK